VRSTLGIEVVVSLLGMIIAIHNQRRQDRIDFHRRETTEALRRAEQALERFDR
jgi:Tfp pilus assembly protein PilX